MFPAMFGLEYFGKGAASVSPVCRSSETLKWVPWGHSGVISLRNKTTLSSRLVPVIGSDCGRFGTGAHVADGRQELYWCSSTLFGGWWLCTGICLGFLVEITWIE